MLNGPRAAIRWLFEPAAEYGIGARLFLKALALIYFAAFASLVPQIEGLAGSQGMLPFHWQLEGLHDQVGAAAYWRLPNIFWLDSGDTALTASAVAGCLFALLLLFNRLPRLSLAALFVLYLSLFHAGQIFMNFQWDYLLLEAGFLAMLLAGNASRLVIWLFHWLLFRLRFESGISKLISGDVSWADFSALHYYFETQPLPHWGAWYAHQLPDWTLRAGTGLVFFAELLVPFLLFLPRRFRLFAAWVTLLMQVLILLTSNHNFFNLLTMALCLFLFDDQAFRRVMPWLRPGAGGQSAGMLRNAVTGLAAMVIVTTSTALMAEMLTGRPLSAPIDNAIGHVRAFGIAQRYHVFPTIRTERLEVQLEGSADGEHWVAYEFRYKPGDLAERPAFIVPHQPRLDWMMWFVTLSLPMNVHWLDGLTYRLFEGAPAVTGLLRTNPFAAAPPRMIRAQLYRYRFTTPEERRKTGDWWAREFVGPLLPYPWMSPTQAAR